MTLITDLFETDDEDMVGQSAKIQIMEHKLSEIPQNQHDNKVRSVFSYAIININFWKF